MAGNNNSGRRSGERPEKPFLEALRMEISESATDHKKLRRIAKVLLARCEAGDMAAIKELADRLDGKPTQIIEGTMDHEHRFVRAP